MEPVRVVCVSSVYQCVVVGYLYVYIRVFVCEGYASLHLFLFNK